MKVFSCSLEYLLHCFCFCVVKLVFRTSYLRKLLNWLDFARLSSFFLAQQLSDHRSGFMCTADISHWRSRYKALIIPDITTTLSSFLSLKEHLLLKQRNWLKSYRPLPLLPVHKETLPGLWETDHPSAIQNSFRTWIMTQTFQTPFHEGKITLMKQEKYISPKRKLEINLLVNTEIKILERKIVK